MLACRGKTYLFMDKRVSIMGEIISGMRIIKMYCWEKPYGDIVDSIRKQEVSDSMLGETIWVHCGFHHKTMLWKCKWNIEICERWKTHFIICDMTCTCTFYLCLEWILRWIVDIIILLQLKQLWITRVFVALSRELFQFGDKSLTVVVLIAYTLTEGSLSSAKVCTSAYKALLHI